jgi:multiple antibiotic resistance protein
MKDIIPFLAILNPFALCLYLIAVMEDLETRDFMRVIGGACVISMIVFALFALTGEALLINILGVRPEALRMFGGIIFFIIAYNYAMKGHKAAEILRGPINELPSAIALPFMIGAGTITQSILIGKNHPPVWSVIIIITGVCIAFLAVTTFKLLRDQMKNRQERLFDRYVNILSRINGLIIGAISTEMVVSSLKKLWS